MDTRLTKAVDQEIANATAAHGPLTVDGLRVLAILVEEVGEVSRALLELGRAERRCAGSAEINCLNNAVTVELIQVIAVATQLAARHGGYQLY